MKGTTGPAALEKKFEHIEEQLSRGSIENRTIEVTCSIGAATAKRNHIDFNAVFQAADAALYQNKSRGENTFVICSCPDS